MSRIRDLANTIIGALAIVVVLRSFAFATYHIPSESMVPTLEVGDRVAALKFPLGFSRYSLVGGQYLPRFPGETGRIPGAMPARGDVVVFDSPRDGERLIKRVVAVAGDDVSLHGGTLVLNGRPLARDGAAGAAETLGGHRVALDLSHGGGPDIDRLRIPAGKLLVLGDHRGNSLDGRYFGLVDADAVYGRAMAVYYRRGDGLGWTRL